MTAVPTVPPALAGRRIAPVVGVDEWRRCFHHRTVVDPFTGDVLLDHQPRPPGEQRLQPAGPDAEPAGLAFDRGHLYHGVPERGQIERVPWPRRVGAGPVDLLGPPQPPAAASSGRVGFVAVGATLGRPLRARALATDSDEHLFVLDGATGAVAVVDLVDGRLLRTITPPWPPVDLAAAERSVLVATASRRHPLVEVDAVGTPREVVLAAAALAGVPPAAVPSRVAVGPDGTVWLLLRDGGDAWITPVTGPTLRDPIAVAGATDLEVDGEHRVVAAGPPDRPLRTWAVVDGVAEADVPLLAPKYDGRGIVRNPDGRIGYWNGTALRVAATERVAYLPRGHVDTYALDSLAYQQTWGRVFVEACVPPGTDLTVGFATTDDLPEGTTGPIQPPDTATTVLALAQPLHRRETGREVPWAPPDPHDRYEVYEAPVSAQPGRYLWVRFALAGTSRATPRIRALRAEFPSHDLLRKLPRSYRRDPVAASFLRRYLALIDGMLTDMLRRACERDLLLDPRGAPEELLPWLASLIGLTLDERWPVAARRTLLAEAVCLYRKRGTVPGLRRLLEIYLQCPVVILEEFRLRGSGGAFVGGDTGDPGPAPAVVGSTLRVGGEVAPDADTAPADAFRLHAHRFAVLVARDLDADRLAVVRELLDLHRPAHTVASVCTVGIGMRVGVSLHLEVSTIVGPSSGFVPAVVGSSAAGPATIVGQGRAGIRAGGARLGEGTVIDP
ncbi:phage tail protein [Micromonospora arborensis]|uniref:phage tail protein n=1 Tax=Micromonospora arborensis TaxID=2116518 RepID=UPI0033ECD510